MDPITIGLSLIKFAPDLVKWFTGSDKDAAVAQKAVDLAQSITGTKTGEDTLEALGANPELALKFKQAVLDSEIKFQELAVQNASDVNKSIQTEAAAEHWPTYSWRPAIGFAVAFAVIMSVLTVFLAYGLVVVRGQSDLLTHLPGILGAVAMIIGTVSPILGIASWYRGKMQADSGKV